MMKGRNFGMARLAVFALAMAAASAAMAADEAPGRGAAEIALGGKKVKIDYGRPSTDGAGYKSMQKGIPEGTLWRMGKDEATKLETEVDLKIGDKVVKAGTYALWAKRVGNAWELCVSSKVATPSGPDAKDSIIATAPMKAAPTKEPVKWMTIELKAEGQGGVFKLAWGKEEGTVAFTVAK